MLLHNAGTQRWYTTLVRNAVARRRRNDAHCSVARGTTNRSIARALHRIVRATEPDLVQVVQ